MTVTLLWVDSDSWTAGWIERSAEQRTGREGRREQRKKTWYSENYFNFSSALRPIAAQGNNKRLLQPLFLFWGYREVKPTKNSVTAFVCVCIWVCVCCEHRQTTCIMTSINLHTPGRKDLQHI